MNTSSCSRLLDITRRQGVTWYSLTRKLLVVYNPDVRAQRTPAAKKMAKILTD